MSTLLKCCAYLCNCAEDVDSICDRNPTVRTNFNVNASYNGSNILNDQCEANMPPNTPFPQNR